MSEMLERVAKAIQEAVEKPKYVVKIGKVWECWDNEKCIKASHIHAEIDDECDRLNAEYTARKAVEALKQPTDEMKDAGHLYASIGSVDAGDAFTSMINCVLNE